MFSSNSYTMRWFLMIALVSCYPSCLGATCKGCIDASKLRKLEKQLELMTNEVKSLIKSSEGMYVFTGNALLG